VNVLQLPALLGELPKERTKLLDNLGRIRREIGPVTPELSDALADAMNLRRGDVHEVASFYSYLHVPLETPRVCTGPVCDSLGAHVREGELEVAAIGNARTQLGLSANYEPPLGVLGKIADRALLHRVAEVTVKDFLERIGARLESDRVAGGFLPTRT